MAAGQVYALPGLLREAREYETALAARAGGDTDAFAAFLTELRAAPGDAP